MDIYNRLLTLWLGVLLVSMSGCISMATQRLADNLSHAILDQNDPATVRDAAPAYLVLIDSLIVGSPEDQALLIAGAKLYSSYATIFVTDKIRAQTLADKARTYARQAVCLNEPQVCELEQRPFAEFAPLLAEFDKSDLAALYTYATAWAGRIQTRSGEWSAIADVPKVEALLERVIELDETFDGGQAHLYLGVIRSQLSPALGGQPEKGRAHFERAIELSQGKNLTAKVEFARHYARLTFDRDLHDRLLQETLAADPNRPGSTLSNVLAQQQAQQLLATAVDYFGD